MTAGASRTLTRDDLRSLFENATRSVFRLETLQGYDAPGEAERVQAFMSGQESWRRPADDESLRMIRETTAQGIVWSRVHVLEKPLTDYLRFELAAYHENETAGEAVWIADRGAHPDLAGLREDFVLIDDRAGVLFRYDQAGRRLAWERIADDHLDRYRRHRALALARAVRLAAYHAGAITQD
jgi:Family of unknown function (DUF6879)